MCARSGVATPTQIAEARDRAASDPASASVCLAVGGRALLAPGGRRARRAAVPHCGLVLSLTVIASVVDGQAGYWTSAGPVRAHVVRCRLGLAAQQLGRWQRTASADMDVARWGCVNRDDDQVPISSLKGLPERVGGVFDATMSAEIAPADDRPRRERPAGNRQPATGNQGSPPVSGVFRL